jgi:hypothetical protein
MNCKIWTAFFLTVICLLSSTIAEAESLIVTFHNGAIKEIPENGKGNFLVVQTDETKRSILSTGGIRSFRPILPISAVNPRIEGPYKVELLTDVDAELVIQQLLADPLVAYAARLDEDGGFLGEYTKTWFPPGNKIRFCDSQFNLHKREAGELPYDGETCSYPSGFGNNDMDAPQAWGVTKGSPDVLVGIIDTGFDWTHIDLGGQMPSSQVSLRDSLYTASQNGVFFFNENDEPGDANNDGRAGVAGYDDDNDGTIDEDSRGWDFRNDPESDVYFSIANDAVGLTIFDENANFSNLEGLYFYGCGGDVSCIHKVPIVSNTPTSFTTAPDSFHSTYPDGTPFLYVITDWSSYMQNWNMMYRIGDGQNNNEVWDDPFVDDAGWENDTEADDDENGASDDCLGYDFFDLPGQNGLSSDNIGFDNDVRCFAWPHGTACLSMLSTTNDVGRMMGVAPSIKIIPVRTGGLDDQGNMKLDKAAMVRGLEYLKNMGVDVLSTSFGTSAVSGLEPYFQELADEGVVIVNGAGNKTFSTHSLDSVEPSILVAGVDQQDCWVGPEHPWAQYGSFNTWSTSGPWVDICSSFVNYVALPVGTSSPIPANVHEDGSYDTWAGTSLSGPIVAGVVALVKSTYPHYTRDELINKVLVSVDNVYNNQCNSDLAENMEIGFGRVNAYKAITFYGNVAAVADTTWSHNIWLSGDVRVPNDRTLTISAGDTVRIAIDDILSAGENPNEVEFNIEGTLVVQGSPSNPVTFLMHEDSPRTWVYDFPFELKSCRFVPGGARLAVVSQEAHSPLMPDNGAADQVFSVEIDGISPTESAQVDLEGLGLSGTILSLLDDGQGQDLVADDGIFTSQSFQAFVSGGNTFSVDVRISNGGGIWLEKSVLVDVPELMAKMTNISTETGISFAGMPYSGLSSSSSSNQGEDIIVSVSYGGNTSSTEFISILPSGAPYFLGGTSLVFGGARGLSSADFDNDGDEDLFIAHSTTPKLYRNDSGSYTDVTASMGLASLADHSTMGCWGDYNNDGWIDIYVTRCGLNPNVGTEPPGYNNIYGASGRLFRNDGGNGFTNVTTTAFGCEYSIGSVSASWGDINNDGHMDLGILSLEHPPAHMMVLLVNQGDGTFSDEFYSRCYSQGVEILYGTALVWADMNNDGWQDMVVSSASAGSQILFNDGQGVFPHQASVMLALGHGTAGGTGFSGLQVFDHDLDGWQDVLLTSMVDEKPSRMFLGKPTVNGVEYVENTHNFSLAGSVRGIGSLTTDFTSDGDLDLYLATPVSSGEFFYKTDKSGGSNSLGRSYVKVYLDSPDTTTANRQGIGAVVTIHADGNEQTQSVDGGSGRGGQKSRTLVFGLGDFTGETVTADVRWPGGVIQQGLDLIVSDGQGAEVMNVISDALPDIQNLKAEMVIDPVTGEIDWKFSWDTTYATVKSGEEVQIYVEGISRPCFPAGIVISPYSSGAHYRYEKDPVGGYTHSMEFPNWDCTGCAFRYHVSSYNGLQEATSSLQQKSVKFCPTQF